jgi:protein-tyrosine phosphatase
MKPEIYWIPGPWPGRLGILLRPRGGDWLPDEVRSWRDAGLDAVVSLLTQEEAEELGLQEEATLSRERGIEFHAFPIPDRGVPESREATAELVRELKKALEVGRSVAVHCRQGVGRSALISALLLVEEGEDPGSALGTVEEARGAPVPDTEEQRGWIGAAEVSSPTEVVSSR